MSSLRAVLLACGLVAAGWAARDATGPETLPANSRSPDPANLQHSQAHERMLQCEDTPRSTFISQVCFDAPESMVIVVIRGKPYAYCNATWSHYRALADAPSVGRAYNQRLRGNSSHFCNR